MAKMVGYACNMKLQWLNYAISLLEDNLTEIEYKQKLNDYLSFEIDSPTRLRKSREIIMNTWYHKTHETTMIRDEALSLLKAYPEYSIAIHLCMLYLAYPVVVDVCKFMGRIFEYQDEITNAVLNQKLYDEWGERETLKSTCRRVTLTLKDMGILENVTRFRYRVNKLAVSSNAVVNFILSIAMRIEGMGYYPFTGLTGFTMLFPFDFRVTKEQLLECNKFTMSNFGGELSVSLIDK